MNKELMKKDRREFLKKLFTLAFPIGIQNLLSSSLSFLDTLMIGQLGVNQIAGVGLGNQIFFLVALLFFGISSGASIFISQFYGAGKIKSIQKVMLIAFIIGLAGALVFAIPSIFFPRFLLRIFTPDPMVIEMGRQYLMVVGISYLFSAGSFVFSTTLRATGDAKTPLLLSFVSLGTNALLNWLLIFGVGPFPRMEVYGAALATVLSRLLEFLLLAMMANKKKSPSRFVLREAIADLDRAFIRSFFRTCLPVVFNEFLWALAMTVYKYVYAHMGTDVLASVNMTGSVQDLFLVFSLGIGNASGIMIGNKIGNHDREGTVRYAWALIASASVTGAFFGVLMAIASPILPRLFNVSEDIYEMTRLTLLYLSPMLIFKSLNTTVITGVLRSGGDTRFAFLAEMICLWCLGVPVAFLTGLWLKLPIYWVCLLICIDEVSKVMITIPRVISGKWINDLTSP